MNTNTPPIIRGEFVYHNVLLVDAGGDLKRHPRASLGDIKTLLDGKTPKDQVAHFYEAQLIHYGLQRSKDKNTAKVRLQQALNQKKLVVPPHIVDMEAQMKKDFAASVRKANKSSAEKAVDTAAPSGAAPGRKRKQSGEEATPAASSKKTKITMKVGDVEFTIDHDSNENTSGTSKKAIKTTATLKSKATPAPAAKQPKTPQTKKAAPQVDTKAKTTTKTATEAQTKPTVTEKATKAPAKPKAEKTTAVKKKTQVKKELASSQAIPKAKPTKIKQEAIKREPSPSPPPERSEIYSFTGVYNVSCPQLEDQYPETTGALRIFICVDEAARKVWGGFELGPKSGVMLIAEYHDDPIDLQLTFGWRARNLDRGGLHFGRGCHGEIEFLEEVPRTIVGTFFNLFPEPVSFQAERRMGPLVCQLGPLAPRRDAWQFEQEWDGFVAEAYGR
ncbi:hypothetical protein Q7P36_007491 [Cladosporium allicinum]